MHFFYLCSDVSKEVFTEHVIVASFLSEILIIFIVVPSSKLSYCLNSLKEVFFFFVHKYSFFPSRTSKRNTILSRSVSFHNYPKRDYITWFRELLPPSYSIQIYIPWRITSWMLVLDSVIHYLLSESFQNDLQQLNINELKRVWGNRLFCSCF